MRTGELREAVRTLNPASFAVVMATGIVSVAMADEGADLISVALLVIAIAVHLLLCVLHGWRLARYRADALTDLFDPARAFGWFTFVAATGVLGVRLAADAQTVAVVLLGVTAVAGLVLGYLVPCCVLLRPGRRAQLRDVDGTWFVWVVGVQAIAVLAAVLVPTVATGRDGLALLAVFAWSVGVFLYAAVGIAVGARLVRHPPPPLELTPPYWVAMGATAITVVAGSQLVLAADAGSLGSISGAVAGTSVVFWCFGTWLVPVLVAAGVWRHFVHGVPLRYDPALWSAVFPIGMYGVAGDRLGLATDLPLVRGIASAEGWLALAVWAVTFLAMLVHLAAGRSDGPARMDAPTGPIERNP